MKKKILLGLLGALLVIQLIRPERNETGDTGNGMNSKYPVPQEIEVILQRACYDCHSNTTRYPWYSNIQPIGWWLQSHVNEGKEELNFSEFATYNEKRARHKFEEIDEVIGEGSMPLSSYTMMHEEARLTPNDAVALRAWAATLK